MEIMQAFLYIFNRTEGVEFADMCDEFLYRLDELERKQETIAQNRQN